MTLTIENFISDHVINGRHDVFATKQIMDDIIKNSSLFDEFEPTHLHISSPSELALSITAFINLMRLQYTIDNSEDQTIESLLLGTVGNGEHAVQYVVTADESNHPLAQINAITTHPVKYDERVSSGKNIVCFTKKQNNSHGFSGFDATELRELTFSGNASKLKLRTLLLLEFYYQGKSSSVLEMLVKKDSAIIEALSIIGFNNDTITDFLTRAEHGTGGLTTVVGKQMYFASDYQDDYKYTLISPVISVKMQREVNMEIRNNLINQGIEDLYWIPKSINFIGGEQPQNSSYLLSKYGGMNRMLSFGLPSTERLSIIESRLLSGKSLINDRGEIDKVLLSNSVHFNARNKFSRAVSEWCNNALSLFDEYFEKLPVFEGKSLAPKDPIENKLAQKESLSFDDKEILTDTLSFLLAKRIVASGGELSVEVQDEIKRSVSIFVGSI